MKVRCNVCGVERTGIGHDDARIFTEEHQECIREALESQEPLKGELIKGVTTTEDRIVFGGTDSQPLTVTLSSENIPNPDVWRGGVNTPENAYQRENRMKLVIYNEMLRMNEILAEDCCLSDIRAVAGLVWDALSKAGGLK